MTTTRRTRLTIGLSTAAAVAAAAVIAVTASSSPSSAAGGSDDGMSAARAATAKYHDVATAKADGFAELKDAAGIACIDKPNVGAMGIHYVLGSRVGDAHEDASAPELVIYEPQKDGKLKLVAVEWVVTQQAWANAGNSTPPSLFGQDFTLVPSPNRYGLPPFFELHAWLWQKNPAGMFEDFNPNVSCANA